MRPVVSNELFAAGLWARTHVPVGCVDYLVGNEYTAYWLHLAVLGNPRISSRTGDDDTFLTQPSMARWLAPRLPLCDREPGDPARRDSRRRRMCCSSSDRPP